MQNINRTIYLMMMKSDTERLTPLYCAINMGATTAYTAPPSILTVMPTGSTKPAIRGSIPSLCSTHCIVIGSVAELKHDGIAIGSVAELKHDGIVIGSVAELKHDGIVLSTKSKK